jgi:hypothetical protein
MTTERIIRRYSAYYSGWCVAFGEHEITYEEDRDLNWLFGEAQIGVAVTPRLRRILLKELLGTHSEAPRVTIGDGFLRINDFEYAMEREEDVEGLRRLKALLEEEDEIHMFLTSHFCYPKGMRIITFSTKKPLVLIYKEMEPLELVLDPTHPPR